MIQAQPWFDKIAQKNLEKLILDRIITTRESSIVNEMIIKKITADYFEDDLHKSIFNYIIWQFNESGIIPSDIAIETLYKEYIVAPVNESIVTALDELIYRWTVRTARDLIYKITTEINTGKIPIRLIRDLHDIYTMPRWVKEEGYFVWKSDDFVNKIEQRIINWEDFTGIKVWLKYLDEDFAGIQPTDFIGVLADEKIGKSWFMLWLAYQMRANGKNVLFFSPEMDITEVEQRLHLIHTNFNSKDFFQGKLTPEQFVEWREKNKWLKKNLIEKRWWEIVIIDDIELTDFNLTTIKARMERLDTQLRGIYVKSFPNQAEYYEKKKHFFDCIIIDGFHLLNGADLKKNASEWKESQLVSQGLRSFARIEKIPILVSLHTNRDKQKIEEKIIPDARDTSMTASLWRDLTCLLSLFTTPYLTEKSRIWMSCTLSRRSSKWKIWTFDFNPEQWLIRPIQKIQTQAEFDREQNEANLWS